MNNLLLLLLKSFSGLTTFKFTLTISKFALTNKSYPLSSPSNNKLQKHFPPIPLSNLSRLIIFYTIFSLKTSTLFSYKASTQTIRKKRSTSKTCLFNLSISVLHSILLEVLIKESTPTFSLSLSSKI